MSKYDNNFAGSLPQARREGKDYYYNGTYCANGFNSMKRTSDKMCMCGLCEAQAILADIPFDTD